MKPLQKVPQDSSVILSSAYVLSDRARMLVASVQQPCKFQVWFTTAFLAGPVGVGVLLLVVVVVVVEVVVVAVVAVVGTPVVTVPLVLEAVEAVNDDVALGVLEELELVPLPLS